MVRSLVLRYWHATVVRARVRVRARVVEGGGVCIACVGKGGGCPRLVANFELVLVASANLCAPPHHHPRAGRGLKGRGEG